MNVRAASRIIFSLFVTLVLMTTVLIRFGWAAGPITIIVKPASIIDGLSPSDPGWNSATQYTIALDTVISAAGMPQTLPSSKWKYMKVKVMRNSADIYFRLEWPDSTRDTTVADAPLFADAAALEIPFPATAGSSSIAMGNQFGPMNIIFWRAELGDPTTGMGHPQNIVAGGAGTVQTSPDSDLLPISHYQLWAANTWTVIFKRPLSGAASTAGNMVGLEQGKNYRICFAAWDGNNQERNGVKLVAGNFQTLFIQ